MNPYLEDDRFINLSNTSVTDPDYELVFQDAGLNYVVNPYTGTEIPGATILYVCQDNQFIPIGTLTQLKKLQGLGGTDIIGKNGVNYGDVRTLHLYQKITQQKLDELAEDINVSTDPRHIPGKRVLLGRDTKGLISEYLGGKRKRKTKTNRKRKNKRKKSRRMRK